MPGNLLVAVFVFGAILILIALLGGSFRIFGADIPMKLNGRTRIVAGILGTVLIVFSLAAFTIQNFKTNSKSAEQEKIPPEQNNLNIEQIRLKITKALHEGKVTEAVKTLRNMTKGEVKNEECERIFSYCIKNHKLVAAKDVANDCWEGEKREQAFDEIGKESLKSP